MARLNSDFHFRMFTASGLDLVVAEPRRVWRLSDGYRACLLHDPMSQKRIVDEHAEMVEALRVRDHERLVSLMDHHRDGTRPQLESVLT
ncbi:FCD domain-containing protein [Streptomyces fractus]|uniref:FCD domain-containing protein n=1 Tax=Streptomyces fractus TaxID=641806 RepID=UPI003CE9EC3B